MFEDSTAFRHFNCGGPIFRRQHAHRTRFRCATCWEWSEDLLDLVKDPDLKTAASDMEDQIPFADATTD